MNFGNIITADCENIPPPDDPRCSDLAFAMANPSICPIAPFLVLKPAIGLLCTLGSIQMRAVYTKDGVEEDVTDESIFSTSDPTIAVIGAISGNATGVGQGTATFKAVYNDGTNDVEAFSEVTVLGENCCDEITVAIMVCVDNSKSMSLSFGSGYTSRLAFAKAAAVRFINEVNEEKDLVGLLKFNDATTDVLAEPTSDKASVSALVPGIPQTQQITSFHECITQAIASLDAVTGADRKIIVIISDGEDSTGSYNDTNNPIAVADDFKSSGGIVICLGCRASGRGFALLSRLSTGGFFVNGYSATAAAALDYLSGLKGYVCAGNCVPAGDEYVASGAFNYNEFINWDVEGGFVDLQGYGFFDYLPGNGLYVDLISGMQPSGTANGRLVLKDAEAIAIQDGHDYRLVVSLAGNQQIDRIDTVLVQVFWKNNDVDETPTYLLNQIVTLSDYTQDFSDHSFAFSADGDRDIFISIQHSNVPTGDYARAGALLGRVKFDDVTDLTNLFDDDFNTENLEYIPPACGTGTTYIDGGYVTGYSCYGDGCLDEPPPAQLQDPSPLADVEGGYSPPQVYTSTKTKCATCDEGFTNAPATNLVPDMTSATAPSGTVFSSGGEAVGFEAWKVFDQDDATYMDMVGVVAGQVGYQFTSGKVVTSYAMVSRGDYTFGSPRAWTFEGSNNGTAWTVLDTRSQITWFGGERKLFGFTNATSYTYYRLNISNNASGNPSSNLSLATLEMFASVVTEACATATAESEVSQQHADTQANEAALADAQAQLNCVAFYTSTKQWTAHCQGGTFGQSVTKSATRTSLVSQEEADDAAELAAKTEAEDARDCTLSNNGQMIQLNNGTVASASPYPSVKYVSGLTGTITKVTLTLKQIKHHAFQVVCLVLRSPDGTTVMLLNPDNISGEMVFSTPQDVTFDDDAATTMPYGIPHAGGTFKPTIVAGGHTLQFPGTTIIQPYGIVLSDFDGLDPNGSWSLWAIHKQFYTLFNPVNARILNGWDLTIST